MSITINFGGRTLLVSDEVATILSSLIGAQLSDEADGAVEQVSAERSSITKMEAPEMSLEEATEYFQDFASVEHKHYRPTVTKNGTVKVKRIDSNMPCWIEDNKDWFTQGLVFDDVESMEEVVEALNALMYEEVCVPKNVPAVGEQGYFITMVDGVFVVEAHVRSEQDDYLVTSKRLSRNEDNAERRASRMNNILCAVACE